MLLPHAMVDKFIKQAIATSTAIEITHLYEKYFKWCCIQNIHTIPHELFLEYLCAKYTPLVKDDTVVVMVGHGRSW